MAIQFENNQALFTELVSVEEAETLLEWLQQNPTGEIDLEHCDHLHASVVQVLVCMQAKIAKWPTDQGLKMWLSSGLKSKRE